jgi:hypothetical protein
MNNITMNGQKSRADNGRLLSWPGGKFRPSSALAEVGRQSLPDMDLFNDEVLADLLDSYPRNRLQAWTMGTDPLRREDWKPVDTAGVNGKDLLTAVKRGRLWYNILRIDMFDRKYREIVDRLYAEMAEDCPAFKPLSAVGTLLLSSPDAMVYYHADGPPTTLFHVRGRKRMWVYPAGDERFVSQYFLEEIFGSAMDEEVPYSPDFDQHAAAFDLEPGDVIWWPQNAPHRIQNSGSFNVSLSTRYQTADSERRKLVYTANRFFRQKMHFQRLKVDESGWKYAVKCFTYRACRRAGLDKNPPGYHYATTLRVDPTAPLGFSELPEATRPAFSR